MVIDSVNFETSEGRLSVNTLINGLSDQAAARFESAVRPSYGVEGNGRLEHLGSCFLLTLDAKKLLLTAAHVAEHTTKTRLFAGGGAGLVLIDTAYATSEATSRDRNDDIYDFAATILSERAAAELGGGFIAEEEMLMSADVQAAEFYVALGFPCSKQARIRPDDEVIQTTLFRYTAVDIPKVKFAGTRWGKGDQSIFLEFEPSARDVNGRKVSSIKPHGMSGGLVIQPAMPLNAQVANGRLWPVFKITGMIIAHWIWKRHYALICTRMFPIIPALREMYLSGSLAASGTGRWVR